MVDKERLFEGIEDVGKLTIEELIQEQKDMLSLMFPGREW